MNSKKILITGGLGFIGSSLARRLVGLGHEVTLVDSLIPLYGGNLFNVDDIKDSVRINVSDVRDPHSFPRLLEGQDWMFNLAGQTSHLDSMTDPFTDLDINAKAQLSILESCRKINPKVRIVFASTRQIYGKPQYLPVDENHPLIPVDVNGINKLAGEHYHLLYHRVYGLKTVVLRLTNTYGPGMRVKDARQTFLGIWIKNLVEGKPLQIFGDGLQLRDFNFVDDVVDAMLNAINSELAVGKIYNLGGPERIGLKELAETMVSVFGTGKCELIPFPPDRKAIDIGDYYSDFSRITNDLGWRPSVTLKDGLGKSLSYYKQHLGKYL
ncbi:MAG: NAD-dependent epimerase/dehydratase family protein [Proteobacteria bacterium]|nr:NAD-dependent epimerase/dehydratase family protein [Pseudomonadota bacterium]NDC25284.1 NAD-dependent epimerase/dehydratase family protein [Pseudomonadota bacterium]NDD05114.1 NAD-dependent epimerase/dehydratase family protein [Pseudomonadota bacterium]NDG27533.1 NAD-dependent epimerase/dehydratase family protein [Pseudomonadota bacterium]